MSNLVIIIQNETNKYAVKYQGTHSSMATATRCNICTLEPLKRVKSESDDNDPSE